MDIAEHGGEAHSGDAEEEQEAHPEGVSKVAGDTEPDGATEVDSTAGAAPEEGVMAVSQGVAEEATRAAMAGMGITTRGEDRH